MSKSTLPIKTESNEEAIRKTRVVRLKKQIGERIDRDRSLSSVMSTLSDKMVMQQKLDSNPTTNRADGGESREYRITSGTKEKETGNAAGTYPSKLISELDSNIEDDKNIVYKFYEQFLNNNHNRRSSNYILTDKDLFPKVFQDESTTSQFKSAINKKPVRLGPAASAQHT